MFLLIPIFMNFVLLLKPKEQFTAPTRGVCFSLSSYRRRKGKYASATAVIEKLRHRHYSEESFKAQLKEVKLLKVF